MKRVPSRLTGRYGSCLAALFLGVTAACTVTPSGESENRRETAPDANAAPRPVELELEPYSGRLRQVEVGLGGEVHPFLFDTGGGLTLIDPDLASSVGCEPSGRIIGYRMSGERVEFPKCGETDLRLGPLELSRFVAIFDLMALLPDGMPPLAGVASLHTLGGRAFTLDLAEDRLVVETEESLAERIQEMRELGFHLERDMGGRGLSAFLEVEAERGTLRLLVDSGNLAGFILAPQALEQLGLEREVVEDEPMLDLSIVGLGRARTPVLIAEIRHDGVIGAEFLERLELTADLATGRAWARWKN